MQQMQDDNIPGDQRAGKDRGIKSGRCVQGITCLLNQLVHTLCLGHLIQLRHRFGCCSMTGTCRLRRRSFICKKLLCDKKKTRALATPCMAMLVQTAAAPKS